MTDARQATLATVPNAAIAYPSGPIAITGASGFIGKHLVGGMRDAGLQVLSLARKISHNTSTILVDLSNQNSIEQALYGVDTVLHSAGYAHAHQELRETDERKHRTINCDYALNAARAAARAGVRRFVFLSSVKAAGDPGAQCVDESFAAEPESAYGRSKRAAEGELAAIGAQSGLEVVVLRLCMVYGPGSRGNLERMLRLVAKGWFPSLPETGNKRSLVHVFDVISAVELAIRHPNAAGRTYIVAHPKAVSGRMLYQEMRSACGLLPATWSVPERVLRVAGKSGDAFGQVIGRRLPLDSQSVDRLLNSACYSPAAIQKELGWSPAFDLTRGLRTCAAAHVIEETR